MRPSLFTDLNRGSHSRREPRARRIAEILSILFLVSLGTVATLTSARVGGLDNADAQIAITALPSASAR